MRKANHFIDEQELLTQWQLWKDSATNPQDRKAPDRLIDLIYLVAQHLLEHPRFVRYKQHDKDDMKQEAVLKCMKNLKNYKPEKGKMFSYLTYCCWTAYVVYLAQYYKEMNQRREQILEALKNIDEKQFGSIKYLKGLLGDLQETVESYRDNGEKDE